jgi:hypothetical protein
MWATFSAMAVVKQADRCRFCMEPISVGAIRCKHCHADLSQPKKKSRFSLDKFNTFRFGFLSGVLFCTALAVLAYFHFKQ